MKEGFSAPRVKYQNNGDFVENPQNQYTIFWELKISCNYQ
jgi:hypothetical protein